MARASAGGYRRNRKHPRRADRPNLTRERILGAALEIVDRAGLEGLSMRSLGAALGVDPMACYRHFSCKAELLDGVVERVLGTWRVDPPPPPGIDGLRARCRALRLLAHEHPNAFAQVATRQLASPAGLRPVEDALAALIASGVEPRHALRAFLVLLAYVTGSTLAELSARQAKDSGHPGPFEVEVLTRLPQDEFPRIRALATPIVHIDYEQEFEAGLDLALEAVARRFTARRRFAWRTRTPKAQRHPSGPT
jgi:AcrR family transcriptional regulator